MNTAITAIQNVDPATLKIKVPLAAGIPGLEECCLHQYLGHIDLVSMKGRTVAAYTVGEGQIERQNCMWDDNDSIEKVEGVTVDDVFARLNYEIIDAVN